MNSQTFFLLNLVLGGVFLFWFLTSRKDAAAKPTQLSLKKSRTAESDIPSVKGKASPAPAPPEASRGTSKDEGLPKVKNLNVLFLYNGHDWDAYEVLGIPAGASLPLVTTRYQELIKDTAAGKREFFDAAYQAILKKT